jgi:hypothetical protein
MIQYALLASCLFFVAVLGASRGGRVDPSNQLPFGVVDTPANGATVRRLFDVGGWALDDSGVSVIRIYVDGRFRQEAAVSVPRPDVSKQYPTFAHGTDHHGWMAALTIAQPGSHVILAQAVDNEGATRDLATIRVTVEGPTP